MKRRKVLPLLALMVGLLLLPACAKPPAEGGHFRSEQFHLEAALPPGWAAAQGPTYLAKPFTGWVAFNSWGSADLWAQEVVTETNQGVRASYSPQDILGQLPSDGAYVVLNHFSGGPFRQAEHYGPEHEQRELTSLGIQTDCREGEIHPGATYIPFFKWGRRLRLEVYCAPDVSDATAAEVSALLESWRFDRVPAGDVGWATLEARKHLPASVQPERFPLLGYGPGEATSQRGDVVRTTSAEHLETSPAPGTDISGVTVVVTFTYCSMSECPPDRCHWWRVEARPNGRIVLVEEGGAQGWPSATPVPTPSQPFPPIATPTWTPPAVSGEMGGIRERVSPHRGLVRNAGR